METRIRFELVMMLMLMFTEHLLCPRSYLNALCTSFCLIPTQL